MLASIKYPKVSFFLMTYQQESFIEEAVFSVLNQDYPNLQIVISDDASEDATYSRVLSVLSHYSGPHQIVTNQNKKNLGIGQHFAYVMESFVEGDLVVMGAGDDVSLSNRVSRIVEEWLANNKPSFVAHDLFEIDKQGVTIMDKRTRQYALQPRFDQMPMELALLEYTQNPYPVPYLGAALAYDRMVYTRFSTPELLPSYEDHMMYFRALILGGGVYFSEKLVRYRIHDDNFTRKKLVHAKVEVPSLLSPWLGSYIELNHEGLSNYRLFLLEFQEWLDYKKGVYLKLISINYNLVYLLWEKINYRRELIVKLIGNKNSVLLFSSANFMPLRTVLFGTGNVAVKVMKDISDVFNVVAVCDNDSKKHGQFFLGKPVMSPDLLKKQEEEIDCILVASSFFFEIQYDLIHIYNVSPAKICRAPIVYL
ncbi:glycosyltransferase [Thiosulfativibrio zosterae]|uniref:Glycosyltransferase 2-like domain-containing protein n=1 Tax=Thiosulfativibrio zosterae TaxID=2675053 RepID=A0A6F8PM01_9GAMM|nr:glycosyltransferase [Thiosulfativibrio zosterae]BBP43115.1 hypothetical protein THMIRHAT_08610 [Thiosulfativibrio zosterae]